MNYRWKLAVLSSGGLGDELSVEVSCVKYWGFRR